MLDVMAHACNPNIWVTFRKLILSAYLIYQFFGFEYRIKMIDYEIEFSGAWLWYISRYVFHFFPSCFIYISYCLP